MKHLIIGTAGHVDHGKTMLVKALTGVDTDRLMQEKERGISIELGFASLTLPSGKQASIVDVPGHERFIKNMLAGASGIDIVLLIIAADEGVMPQTREHLDIIQLLQIKTGIVVLTKTDLVDEDWLELVEEEVNDFVKETVLDNAPLLKVSAASGKNIDKLLEEIDRLSEETKEKSIVGQPRLPIDRIFSVTGFGTVATGTLAAGHLKIGDEVEIFPQSIFSKIRSLQVHGKSTKTAQAGQRVAVNLTGLEVEQISRGNVLALPYSLASSHRVDVRLLLLKTFDKALKHRARLRLYIGTTEVLGRVIYFDREELKPGEWCYAQLQLEEPVAAAKGERFVIRTYSPMYTIGGGTIIDAVANKHKRYQQDVLDKLATLEKGTPQELIEQYLSGLSVPVNIDELLKAVSLTREQVQKVLNDNENSKNIKVIKIDNSIYLYSGISYQLWIEEIRKILDSYHRKFPLREGYPKEELRSRKFKKLNTKVYQALLNKLEEDQIIKVYPQTLSLNDFVPKPNDKQLRLIQQIEKIIIDGVFQPPGWPQIIKDLKINDDLHQELLHYMLNEGSLIKVSGDLYFHKDIIKSARKLFVDYFKHNKEISIGETRDLLKTSRKYALPLLEYFDKQRFTRRTGDLRVAGKDLI